jgi:hypothetical protein
LSLKLFASICSIWYISNKPIKANPRKRGDAKLQTFVVEGKKGPADGANQTDGESRPVDDMVAELPKTNEER